jgi:predicted PurR-regulated permease PerM
VLDRLPPARRNWALALLAALLLFFAWTVRSALNPLIVALLLAYILHPLVLRLEMRGWSRKLAVNVIFGAVGLCAGVLGFALAIQARSLWKDVVVERRSFEHVRDQLDALVRSGAQRLERVGIDVLPDEPAATQPAEEGEPAAPPASTADILDEIYDRVQAWLANEENRAGLTEAGVRAVGGVWGVIGKVFGSLLAVVTYLFLVPLYTWFLLFELERVTAFVRAHLPRDQRARWSRIGDEMATMLGSFFRGRLLVCFLKGALLSITLAACGVPYALLVGMLSGFLSLVPFVGPAFGYAFAFVLALLEFDPLGAVWRTAVVFTVGEMVEGYVLMPKILGDQLGLHPVVVLASMMIFGSAFGMFGLLLALPLTAALVILARELVLPALRQFAEGKNTPKPAP